MSQQQTQRYGPTGSLFPPLRRQTDPSITQPPQADGYQGVRPESFAITSGTVPQYAKYPPVPMSMEILGQVKDEIKPHDSRDIGRSSVVEGSPYYVFGDTFCKDYEGNFLKTVNNTSAVIEDIQEPLKSVYADFDDAAHGILSPFIPLTSREEAVEAASGNKRVTLWSFGGAVTSEVTGRPTFVWFEKTLEEKLPSGGTKGTSMGTGLAVVSVDQGSGGLRAQRPWGDRMLFGADEPRVGVFSAVAYQRNFYLWGHRGDDIVLARVRDDVVHNKDAYLFWDGDRYVEDFRRAAPVLRSYQHGQFFRSNFFGPSLPWVFVGCTSFGDSKVMMAAAANLEGPWADMTAVCTGRGIDITNGYIYCVYPHPWVFGDDTGELFVTWSEQWPGGVIGAKLEFEMMPARHWIEIDLQNVPAGTVTWAASCVEFAQLAELKRVRMNVVRTALLQRPSLRIDGDNLVGVEEADFEVRRLLARVLNETTIAPVVPPIPAILLQQQPTAGAPAALGPGGRRRSSVRERVERVAQVFRRRRSTVRPDDRTGGRP